MSGNFVCERIFQKLRANICWMYGTVYRVFQDPTIVANVCPIYLQEQPELKLVKSNKASH